MQLQSFLQLSYQLILVLFFRSVVLISLSEYKNETSFRVLQEQASKVKNNVFRDGTLVKIYASEIVVGDYVLLQAGDKIPADGKIYLGELSVVQSSLTGEPKPGFLELRKCVN